MRARVRQFAEKSFAFKQSPNHWSNRTGSKSFDVNLPRNQKLLREEGGGGK